MPFEAIQIVLGQPDQALVPGHFVSSLPRLPRNQVESTDLPTESP